VPWLEQRVATDPELRFVELPAIGRQWEPARPAIDGGIAAAIRDEAVRRRTLIVYTDLRRVTIPLAIGDRSAIWLCLVDGPTGSPGVDQVAWTRSRPLPWTRRWPPHPSRPPPHPRRPAGPEAEQFEMAFDPRLRLPAAMLGVTPAAAYVTVAADRLVACFGGRGSAARDRRT
jgi:hypothetical protein